jgi:hypothetical protein
MDDKLHDVSVGATRHRFEKVPATVSTLAADTFFLEQRSRTSKYGFHVEQHASQSPRRLQDL